MKAMYLRKSRSDEGADLEETLRRHRLQLEALAKNQGYHIPESAIYREVVSGDTLYARPEMLRLLEDIGAGLYDGVLCMDMDRLGRGGMQDQGIILDAFRRSDTLIITPSKTYDLNDETDDELAEMKAFFARRELKAIKKRLRQGREQTIKSGGFLAPAPYGYTKTRIGKLPTLEIVEEEAYFVRMIFNLYTDEQIGSYTIAHTINALGSRPHRGEAWSRSTIMAVLKNPAYIGQVATNRIKCSLDPQTGKPQRAFQPKTAWKIVEGKHPPIIPLEQFERAQRIIEHRFIPSSKTGKIENPFSGLIYCKCCGKLLQRQAPKGKTAYLLCNTAGCVAGTKMVIVEQSILAHMRREVDTLEAPNVQLNAEKIQAKEDELDVLQREMEKLGQQRERLYDLLEQGVYDIVVFRKRLLSLDERIASVTEQQQTRQAQLVRLKGYDRQARAAALRHVLDSYNGSTPAEQNALLKSVFTAITYYRPKKSSVSELTLEFECKNNI